jgi:hypothetical protein
MSCLLLDAVFCCLIVCAVSRKAYPNVATVSTVLASLTASCSPPVRCYTWSAVVSQRQQGGAAGGGRPAQVYRDARLVSTDQPAYSRAAYLAAHAAVHEHASWLLGVTDTSRAQQTAWDCWLATLCPLLWRCGWAKA